MNEKEVIEWAIKGIETEQKWLNKRLKRQILILQSGKKGLQKPNFDVLSCEKKIDDIRQTYELLSRKKAFLVVRLEDLGSG